MRASLTLLIGLASCGEAAAPAPDKSVVLVRKLRPDEAGNAAASGGVLTLENGCLFMAGRDGSRTLLLWPSDARLERSPDGELRVRTGWTHPGHTVRVGEEIFVGGSEFGEAADFGPGRAFETSAAFPPGCTGKVWNVYGIHPGPMNPMVYGPWASQAGPDGPAAVWPGPRPASAPRSGPDGTSSAWPGQPGPPQFTLRCDLARREVVLAHLAPGFNRNPLPEHPVHNPPRPPASMEISAGPDWARYPPGAGGFRVPASDPFLDRLAERWFAVRTGEGVTLTPAGGDTLKRTLSLCRAGADGAAARKVAKPSSQTGPV